MEISSFKPYFILIGLMIITALALAFTVDVEMNDRPGVRMELPATLDEWTGDELRYSHAGEVDSKQYRVSELEFPNIDPKTGEKLHRMSFAEYEALPHDTQFRKSIYTNGVGDRVFVSIVLSGAERNSIHRPQRCLPGQGNSILKTEFIDVPIEGREPLSVCILNTSKKYRDAEGEEQFHLGYYAYWFVGQGRETASHYERMFWLAWDRVIHSVAHKWAYIAVSGERENDETEEYKEEIIDFVQKLYPHLLLKDEGEG